MTIKYGKERHIIEMSLRTDVRPEWRFCMCCSKPFDLGELGYFNHKWWDRRSQTGSKRVPSAGPYCSRECMREAAPPWKWLRPRNIYAPAESA